MTRRQPRRPLPPGDWRLAKTEVHMIDRQGRVYSLHRQRLLDPATSARGYLVVDGGKWRKGVAVYVHRLVLEAFVGPKPEGAVTRHLNGDPTDNRLANLAYGTPAENGADMRRHGTSFHARKTHCPQGHPYDDENTYHMPGGGRDCKECVRARGRRYVARKRQERAAA